jgi:hypothetical protein
MPMVHQLLLQGSCPQPPPPLIRKPMMVATAEMKPVHLRLPCQGGAYGRPSSRRTSMILHCYPYPLFCVEELGW